MATSMTALLLRPEIGRRLLFTAGVLLLYRVGCRVPFPGLDTEAARAATQTLKSEFLSIFGLGVTPFLSVLFFFEFIKLIVPPLSRWEASESGHAQKLSRIVYLLALVIAGFQARGVTIALRDASLLLDGSGWDLVVPLTLVGGTALLCWLGEQITRYGLGNGFWLLVITPTLAILVQNSAGSVELVRMGALKAEVLFAELVFFAVATALIVMTSRTNGASPESRVSGAGFASVWPPLLAVYVIGFFKVTVDGDEVSNVVNLLLLTALIAAFNGLQWLGTAPAARRPIWAIILVQIFVCVGAKLLTDTLKLPFPIDGAWLIVIVITAMSCVRSLSAPSEALRVKEAAA